MCCHSLAMETHLILLPKHRIVIGEVFLTNGVDLCGPVHLKNGKKAWIVLITLFFYRCVHLDIVKSLDTCAFFNSLNRFVYKCDGPSSFSDNGSNFVGTNTMSTKLKWVEIESEVKQIQWILYVNTTSWQGGFFERLIRPVENLLRKTLENTKLNEEELRNILGAVINMKPLTAMVEDVYDL